MHSRNVRSPVIHKPTRANSTGEHFHTNFASDQVLGTTCGFLKGTGYLDQSLLPGSNVLRHKLPPVRLQRSASSPAQRDADLKFLSEMKALEGGMGQKGIRLIGKIRERAAREKLDAACTEGDMKAVRAAVRGAHWGPKLHKDVRVQGVSAAVAKYDKCLIECRDGLANRDMIRVQLAMDHLEELTFQGLGPRIMEHPILMDAAAALRKWAPFRPYLHKLGMMLLAGPRPFAHYWLVLVEGTLLSAELEAQATADLARFGVAGLDALEEALAMTEVRYHYDVPWPLKNPLPQQVRGRLAMLGVDVSALKIRVVRERDAQGWPEPDAPVSVVVTGPTDVVRAIEEFTGEQGEPMAAGRPAGLDTPEQRDQRAAAHRQRVADARSALEGLEKTRHPGPGCWDTNMFAKTF